MGLFNKHSVVYDLKTEIPHRVKKVREVAKAEHDRPFRPSNPPKVGHNKTLAAFPDYKENPLKFTTRKKTEEGGEDEKPAFKMTHVFKTRPTPSVQTNLRNLKTSFPSVFRK